MANLKFWGVQGSCPGTSFTDTLGCNTSCVSIEANNNLIILDAGSGLRILSNNLTVTDYDNVILIITHSHWDHVQGFPFFKYLFSNCTINIYSHNSNHYDALRNQLNGTNFPLDFNNIIANINLIKSLDELNSIFQINVSTINTNHHGDCIGIRMKGSDFDITYIPDNQLHNTGIQTTSKDEFVSFCKNTELLIHDSQYTMEDMPLKKDWGHSIYTDTLNLAVESNVKQLALFHHDPNRSKKEILKLEEKCNEMAPTTTTFAAYEGKSVLLLGNQPTQQL